MTALQDLRDALASYDKSASPAEGVIAAARHLLAADAMGVAAARRYAGWYLGDPAWANTVIEAYLDPRTANARMDADDVPARTGTFLGRLA